MLEARVLVTSTERTVEGWTEDERVVAVCLARPVNAMVATVTRRPLRAGVVRRWPTATSYRENGQLVVAAVCAAIRSGAATNLVLCGVDRDDHVVAGPIWCSVSGRDPRDGR